MCIVYLSAKYQISLSNSSILHTVKYSIITQHSLSIWHVHSILFLFTFPQGVKPASYNKVMDPEIKEIIGECICQKKEERWVSLTLGITTLQRSFISSGCLSVFVFFMDKSFFYKARIHLLCSWFTHGEWKVMNPFTSSKLLCSRQVHNQRPAEPCLLCWRHRC